MEAAPTAVRRPGAAVITGGILLLSLVWGSTWLVIADGLEAIPPFTGCALRFFLASGLIATLAGPLARVEGGQAPTWRLRLVYALLVIAVPYGVIYQVERVLPSGLVAVLWSVYPVLLALVSLALLPEDRMGPRQWLGLLVAVAGVGSLYATDVSAAGPGAVPAALLLLVSPATSALGTALVKRDGAKTSSILLNRDGVFLGALVFLVLALVLEWGDARWTTRAVLGVVYLGGVGTALAFSLYFWLLRFAPASRMGVIAYLVPAVAVGFGALLGGERVTALTLVGMGLVLAGVSLVVLRRRP